MLGKESRQLCDHTRRSAGVSTFPLLFVLISDIFMRRIARIAPDRPLRGYADDLAMVPATVWKDLPRLEELFTNFESVSGLALNVRNTVVVPLHDFQVDAFRERLQALVPI